MTGKRWAFWLLLAVVTLIAGASLYAYGTRTFHRILYPDAMRYASVARDFLNGDGFVWRQYVPYELATEGFDAHKQYPHFLHPLVISGAMSLFGDTDLSVALASALPTVMGVALLFVIGYVWFDLRVALVAALVYGLGEQTLYVGLSGLTEPLFTALLLLSVFCFAQGLRSEGRRAPWMICAGAILGLEQAVRPVGIYYAVPYLLVLVATQERRWRNVGMFTAAFFAFFSLTTWIGAGRFLPVGDPSIGLLTGIGDYKEKYDFHRMLALPPNPRSYALSHVTEVVAKVLSSANHYVVEALPGLGAGNALIGALFLGSWLVRYRNPVLGTVRALLLLLMGVQLAVNLLLWPTDRYFFPFIPLIILFASDYLWRIVDTLRTLALQPAE